VDAGVGNPQRTVARRLALAPTGHRLFRASPLGFGLRTWTAGQTLPRVIGLLGRGFQRYPEEPGRGAPFDVVRHVLVFEEREHIIDPAEGRVNVVAHSNPRVCPAQDLHHAGIDAGVPDDRGEPIVVGEVDDLMRLGDHGEHLHEPVDLGGVHGLDRVVEHDEAKRADGDAVARGMKRANASVCSSPWLITDSALVGCPSTQPGRLARRLVAVPFQRDLCGVAARKSPEAAQVIKILREIVAEISHEVFSAAGRALFQQFSQR
jgi:hypothetical protein